MESTKEPLKILIVGADHDTAKRLMSALEDRKIYRDRVQIVDVDSVSPLTNDPLITPSEIESRRDRINSLLERITLNHNDYYDNVVVPAFDNHVRLPRNQRIAHRQRGDKRTYPH